MDFLSMDVCHSMLGETISEFAVYEILVKFSIDDHLTVPGVSKGARLPLPTFVAGLCALLSLVAAAHWP